MVEEQEKLPPSFRLENASEILLPQKAGFGCDRLKDYTLTAKNGWIEWLGPRDALPREAKELPVISAENRAVTPALVDCHTHILFAGNRIDDFDQRSQGKTYQEILQNGGGIATTVTATRQASENELVKSGEQLLRQRQRYGIGTTEVKSGYGLNYVDELKMLSAIKKLRSRAHDLEATLLAAHTIPRDASRSEYIAMITGKLIPEVKAKKLARFVDVFVENSAFTPDEAVKILQAAKNHGLIPRVHADQLTQSGGAEVAADVGASSADHLEHISDNGADRLRDAGVIAVLLPGAMTYLGDQAPKLGRRLLDRGVETAIATDTNPGSSPTQNLPLMATLAVTQMGLTTEEALRAITLGAANVLRRPDIGSLAPGRRARFLVLEEKDSRALVASFGEPIIKRFCASSLN